MASDDFESPYKKAHCNPVAFWVKHDQWPPDFTEKDLRMAQPPFQKRQRLTSYSKDVRNGKSSEAYSLGYQKEMAEHGLIMDLFQRQATITDDSRQLCIELLSGNYQTPTELLFQNGYFEAVVQGAQDRNEARVARDLLPLIVPSAELLYIREVIANSDDNFEDMIGEMNMKNPTDLKDSLRHITEEVNAEWAKSGTIYGPCPKPDFAAGLRSSAFTHDEIRQLKQSHTHTCPSYMTEDMYFPFLVCEVKSSKQPLVEAERQTMHSASIAVRAIVELYRKVSRQRELDRRILVISISLNHNIVNVYGHYARVTGEKLLFFRHCIDSFAYALADGRNHWKAYNFTRKVYAHFVPIHLDRIRSALSSFDLLPLESEYDSSPNNNTEFPESQALVASTPSSQRMGLQRGASLLSSIAARNENAKLRDEVSTLLRQQEERDRQQQERDRQQQERDRQQQEERERQQQEWDRQQQQQQERERQQQERDRWQEERDRQQQEQFSTLQALLLQQKDEEKKRAEEQKKQMDMLKQQMDIMKQQKEGGGETGGETDLSEGQKGLID